MRKPTLTRPYSRYSRDAAQLLGSLISAARKERRFTVQETAERTGISRGTLQRIEKGDMKCEIGSVFEVAAILSITLFNADETTLTEHLRRTQDKLALLPKSVRRKTRVADDDF
jgi:transcriptional regulator with XRE-family HTH domain